MEFLEEQHASSLLVHTLDLIEDGAVITNAAKPDNPIVFVNKGFERVTGYSKKEVVGRNCRFLQGEETDKSSISEMRRAIKLIRPFERTLLNYRKDGTPFWNRINIKPVRLDNTLYFIGLQYDVTDKINLNVDIEAAKKKKLKIYLSPLFLLMMKRWSCRLSAKWMQTGLFCLSISFLTNCSKQKRSM
ncbi:PAS domain-containing protein [Domibacillus sp. 8LH]|uniref:PAS domain-containing protein n=1 Tax=Domibacillus sp. 8LH TaxID=3073900 RepID=UPI00316E099C